MTAIYGQLFISKHGVQDGGAWFKALNDLTPRALESGVERLFRLNPGHKFCEFPPNALEFRALCLGFYENLNLPSAKVAYRETINRDYMTTKIWSHDVVKYTAKKLGLEFLKRYDNAETFAYFERIYGEVCHLVKQGIEVPEVLELVMLPKPKNETIAINHLNAMRQFLGAAR